MSIGLNCAGAGETAPGIAETAQLLDIFARAYPNAGLPNEFGPLRREPGLHGGAARRVRRCRLGQHQRGCRGTTPEHIAAIVRAAEGKPPRKVPEVPRRSRLSGLEAFTLTPEIPFVNVGDAPTSPARPGSVLVTAGDQRRRARRGARSSRTA